MSTLNSCISESILESQEMLVFPKWMEFVGTDVNDDGNHPARSKFNLLWSWLNLKSAQDVASLFVLPFFTPSSFLTLNSVLVLATKKLQDYSRISRQNSQQILQLITNGKISKTQTCQTLAWPNLNWSCKCISVLTFPPTVLAMPLFSQIPMPLCSMLYNERWKEAIANSWKGISQTYFVPYCFQIPQKPWLWSSSPFPP